MHLGASQLTYRGVAGTARICAIFALVHSLLASTQAKAVVLGSLHEEARLSAAYGAPYDRYRQQMPFLLPYCYSRVG
jgi:protein-S-isoprenylcysteine O-methyltransferase Ste14